MSKKIVKKKKTDTPEMRTLATEKPKQQQEGMLIDPRYGHKIVSIPIDKIKPNNYNSNEMTPALFNELAGDMDAIGVLSVILVTPLEDGTYEIIDGEHRYDVAKLQDMKEIPCLVVDGELSADRGKRIFQTMRMNKLRGQTNYKKLKDTVKELAETYGMSEIAEKLLFTDENQLRALIDEVRTALPSEELKKEFDKAKEDLKTVDELSLLIKRLFTQYGDTLDYHYMILDYGGKDSIWVRIKDKKTFKKIAENVSMVREFGVTADSVLSTLVEKCLTEDFIQKNLDSFEKAEVEGADAGLEEEL